MPAISKQQLADALSEAVAYVTAAQAVQGGQQAMDDAARTILATSNIKLLGVDGLRKVLAAHEASKASNRKRGRPESAVGATLPGGPWYRYDLRFNERTPVYGCQIRDAQHNILLVTAKKLLGVTPTQALQAVEAARRAAASVNACAGIPTEQLEAMTSNEGDEPVKGVPETLRVALTEARGGAPGRAWTHVLLRNTVANQIIGCEIRDGMNNAVLISAKSGEHSGAPLRIDQKIAIARHVVACVNGCGGIGIERLEAIANG